MAVDVERLRGALLRPGAGLSELLVDVTNGFTSEHDAKLAFAARRRFLPDDHCVEDRRTPNAVRGIGTGRREPDAERQVDGNDVDTGQPQGKAPVPLCHVDEKPVRRGRPPKYHTDEDRVAAERQRKLAWAQARRQAGLLKETAESLRERQRRRRARLKASGEVR